MPNFIIDEIKIYSDEVYSDDSDEENFDEKIQMKKVKYINLLLKKNKKNIRNFFKLVT